MINKIKTIEQLEMAMGNSEYSYDIYFRMAVIDEYLNGNECIWKLYNEMQITRCNQNKIIPINMLDHKNEFIILIEQFKQNGFDSNYPILVNKDGLIIDGAHRMACALYFECPYVYTYTNKKYKDFVPNEYTKNWFIENNLEMCVNYAEKQRKKMR